MSSMRSSTAIDKILLCLVILIKQEEQMQFVIVDPARATVERVEANELTVVYEYSLFIPPDKARYFSICNRLFAGGAVLYAADEAGETVDLLVPPSVMF